MEHRERALAGVASTIGFSFRPGPETLGTAPFGDLHPAASDVKLRNIMEGTQAGTEVLLFDCERVIADDMDRYTMAAFRLSEVELPFFQLWPRRFLDRILGVGIRFISHPEFSKRYVLIPQGRNAAAVQTLFNPAVLDALCSIAPHQSVEGGRNWLLIHRPGTRVRATVSDVRKFLEEAHRTFLAFEKHARVETVGHPGTDQLAVAYERDFERHKLVQTFSFWALVIYPVAAGLYYLVRSAVTGADPGPVPFAFYLLLWLFHGLATALPLVSVSDWLVRPTQQVGRVKSFTTLVAMLWAITGPILIALASVEADFRGFV